MPTGNLRTNFADKRHLPQTRFKDTFFDYLAEELYETLHRVVGGRRGVFGTATLSADGADKFKVDALPVECLDGEGHVLILTLASGDATGIQFQNTVGVTYYAAVRHCLTPTGIDRNPRTGLLDYDMLEDRIGLSGNPNSVTEVAGTLRFVVDALFESGVSHAGRKVTVWLNSPKTVEEDVAIERDLPVQWTGGQNVVVTTGLLGQGSGSASVLATDYTAAATGVTVRRNTDLSVTDPYVYLGSVTGVGAGGTPVAFSTAGQIDVTAGLMPPTLDLAYDGTGSAGSGRAIEVDAGAVEMNTDSAGPDDLHNAQLRLSRLASTDYFQLSLEVLMGDVSSVPLLLCQEFGGIRNENCSISGDTITFASANPLAWYLDKDVQFIWLKTGAYAGVYAFVSVGANTVACRDFQTGVTPAWPALTGQVASVMQPRMVFSNGLPSAAPSTILHWLGLLLPGIDGNGSSTPMLTLAPSRGYGKLVNAKNNRISSTTGMMDQRDLLSLDFDAPAYGSPGGRLQLGQWIGTVGAESGVHTKCGLDLRTLVQGSGAADKYALNVKPMQQTSGPIFGKPSTRQVGLFDERGTEIMRWTPFGRMADVHRFVDRFDYAESAIGLPGSERWWARTWGNGGTSSFNDTNIFGTGMQGQGDILHIDTAGIASGDGLSWEGPACWILRTSGAVYRRLRFYARARPIQVNQCVWYGLGIFNSLTTTECIQFRVYDTANVGANWELFSRCSTGGPVDNSAPAATFDSSGNTNNDSGWLEFYFEVDTSVNSISYWMTGMSSVSALNIRLAGLGASDWLDKRVQPFLHVSQVGVLGTNVRRFEVDHMEVWDEIIVAGPKE
jgi:hypothetical protein